MSAVTAAEFIAALGGTRPVCEITGVKAAAVSNWRTAGRIPPRLYLRLAKAANQAGIYRIPEELFVPMPRRTGEPSQARDAA